MAKHWATWRPRHWSKRFLTRKTTANSLTCVKAGKSVKTEADTLVRVEAYTVVDTLNEVEAKALVYTQPLTISQVQTNSVADTLSDMKTETSVDTLTDASTFDDRGTGQHTEQCRD